MFALDYALWFDTLLPGLDRIGVPMPLGGTSNHFRTAVLRDIGGWDAFNVTEDADIGIRLAQMGYRVRWPSIPQSGPQLLRTRTCRFPSGSSP